MNARDVQGSSDEAAGPSSGAHRERWRRIAEMTCSFAYALEVAADGTTEIAWLSPGFTELFGYTGPEIERAADLGPMVVPPEDLPVVEAWMARAVAGERGVIEHRARTKSGDTRWVKNHAYPVRDATGRVTQVDGAVVDITERVRAEEARSAAAATLQAIVDDAPLAIIVVDRACLVTAWNPAATRLFGWSAEEVLGKPLPITREEDGPSFRHKVEEAFDGRMDPISDGLRRRKDGTEVVVSGSRALMRDAAGRPIGLVGMLADISAARREEAMRQRSESNFRTLIELSPDAVAVYQGSAVLYANARMLRLLGYTIDELVGRGPLEFVHPEDRAMVGERIRTYAVRGLETPPAEERFLRKDGVAVPVEVISIPIFFDDMPCTLVHARDLTERKRLEAQLVMADRLGSVGRLAATVGHEINNPLAYVLANLELALERLGAAPTVGARAGRPAEAAPADDALDALDARRAAEIAEMLREAREGAERVRSIVRDLKVFSRGDSDERARIDPRRVLDSCVNMATGEIRHRARLVKRYEDTPRVLANESRLGQVLLNLLINAAHAIPEDATEPQEITVSTSTDPRGRVVIEVRDTGVGMTDEVLQHIFEPFFTTKPGGLGTGLGLSICQSIVTTLGGEITVESAPGRGTSFRVFLPPAPEGDGPPSRLL
jgi:PAS domain S-box-containing protein